MEARIRVHMYGLNPGGVVDMRDGRYITAHDIQFFQALPSLFIIRQPPAVLLTNRGNQQHVGTVHVQLKVLGDVLAQHRWSKGAEAFSIFDLEVQYTLHTW